MPKIIDTLAQRFLEETESGIKTMSPELAAELRGNALNVEATLRARGVQSEILERVSDCYTHLPPNGILSNCD